MNTVWLIRNNVLDDELVDGEFVSVGISDFPDGSTIDLDRTSLAKHFHSLHPDEKPGIISSTVGTFVRFVQDMRIGDTVVAPYSDGQLLRVGTVVSDYYYASDAGTHPHRRKVKWGNLAVPKGELDTDVQNGIRNIATLSRVNRGLELFHSLAKGERPTPQQTPNTDRNIWLVGATIRNNDKTEDFVREGYWKLREGLKEPITSAKAGDLIAIKSVYVRKRDLPFDNNGKVVSCMRIKARGEVKSVQTDRLIVQWDDTFESKEWFFHTYQPAVSLLDLSKENARHLSRFIFQDEEQDIEFFLSQEFWSRYREAADTSEKPVVGTFRACSPSVQVLYEVANRWRESLMNSTSLFSGDPIDYRSGTRDLIENYVNSPDESDLGFLDKLELQLADSQVDAHQIMAELLYIYFLPVNALSTGHQTKLKQIATVTGWKESTIPMPEDLSNALATGLIRVGTAYQTYRWKILQYLVTFVSSLAQLSESDRRTVLTNWQNFQSHIQTLDDQSVWSMRFMLEHLLFPDLAISSSSRDDRRLILNEFSRQDIDVENINELASYLEPNLRYGSRYEVNVYRGPYRYVWQEPDDQLNAWASWAELVLEDQQESARDEELHSAVQHDSLFERIIHELELLGTPSAKHLAGWFTTNSSAAQTLSNVLKDQGDAFFVDHLHEITQSNGSNAEFLEAATAIAQACDPLAPRYFRADVETVLTQLSTVPVNVDGVPPGETLLALLESTDLLSWALLQRNGANLPRAATARLIETLLEIDPQNTGWDPVTQKAFADWRSGRSLQQPPVQQSQQQLLVEDEQQSKKHKRVAQSLEELSERLLFTSQPARNWLSETRDLLQEKKQIILQGPPGTGKTFFAREFAGFLSGDEARTMTVQFHPATSYEDFVQGLRPDIDEPGKFVLQDGPLLRIAKLAGAHPNDTFVLIIDEINRANLPAVFGELYFLLEYRGESITLNYGGEFSLPENLLVIGTMNISDRSIAAIDAALRRRFYIRDLRPEEAPMNTVLRDWLERHTGGEINWLPELVEEANRLINDRDQSVGPSHFLKQDIDETWAKRSWQYTVIPTLEEYFYGQPDRVRQLRFETLKAKVLRTDNDASTE